MSADKIGMDHKYNVAEVRTKFPAIEKAAGKLIYFDNACSVLKPESVISSVNSWLMENGSCGGGRSAHYLAAETDALCENARSAVAKFAGADPDEVIFTGNTTDAVNLAASAFQFLPEKNEAVIFAGSHHSLMLPFIEQGKKGHCLIRLAGLEQSISLPEEEILGMIGEKTAIVALPMASNITGQYFSLDRIIKKAHKHGAYVLADAAAFIPCHVPPWAVPDIGDSCGGQGTYGLPVSQSAKKIAGKSAESHERPDFLAFSGHKIGSLPAGALICRRHVFSRMGGYSAGGGTVSSVVASSAGIAADYLPGRRRYEAGIQNYPGIISFGEASRFIMSLGRGNIFRHVSRLSAILREALSVMPICVIGSSQSSIVSFYFKDKEISVQDFGIFLGMQERKVCLRIGLHCSMPALRLAGIKEVARVSLYAYNSEEEISFFIQSLRKFLMLC